MEKGCLCNTVANCVPLGNSFLPTPSTLSYIWKQCLQKQKLKWLLIAPFGENLIRESCNITVAKLFSVTQRSWRRYRHLTLGSKFCKMNHFLHLMIIWLGSFLVHQSKMSKQNDLISNIIFSVRTAIITHHAPAQDYFVQKKMKITVMWVMAQWPNEMKVNTLPEQLESLGKILCWQQQLCGKLQSCKIMCNNIYYLFLKRRFEDKKCALWKPQVVSIQTICRHKWWFCHMKNWICNTAENCNTTSDGMRISRCHFSVCNKGNKEMDVCTQATNLCPPAASQINKRGLILPIFLSSWTFLPLSFYICRAG